MNYEIISKFHTVLYLMKQLRLAKHFGGADSHKYINGVLDRLSSKLREAEKQQAK